MGQPVRIRTSYAADITFLGRLMQAVEKDPNRSLEWKQQAITALQRAVILLSGPLANGDAQEG